MIERSQKKNGIVFLPGEGKLGVQIDRSDNNRRVQGLLESSCSLQAVKIGVIIIDHLYR